MTKFYEDYLGSELENFWRLEEYVAEQLRPARREP